MIIPTESNKSPFYYMDLEGIIPLDGEYFVHVIFYNGRILPWYYVSNYGRIYSVRYNKIISPYIDKRGYYRVTITIDEQGHTIFTGVHKIMLMSFYPINEPDRFIPNHKDGNPSNNILSNLEWTTVSGNTRHAIENGLCNYIATDNPRSYLDEDKIELICQMIKDGYTNVQILDKLWKLNVIGNDQNQRNKMAAIVRNIRYGSAYMSISMKYNIPGMQGDYRFPEELSYSIRDIISRPESVNYNYDDLANELNIPKERRRYFKAFVQDVFKKAGYSDAAKIYPNAKKPLSMKKTDENYYLYF